MAVSTPSIVLTAGQDTGSSTSDGITKIRFLQITGKATPGNRVILFDDVNRDGIADYPDQTVGGVYAGADGTYSTTLQLADGSYRIFAIADDGTTSSALSTPITVTVDTTAPKLNSVSLAGPQTTNAATVQFTVTLSEPVVAPTVSDFSIVSSAGLQGAAVSKITPVAGSNGQSYTVDVTAGTGSGSLALQVVGESIKDLAGNSFGGAFKTAATYTVGNNPASVTVADVNHDGIADLLVANLYSSPKNADGSFGAGYLSLLIGKGDGTFQQPVSVAAGAGPYVIQTGDFNHDGNTDLAVLNAFAGFKTSGNGNGSVSILFGTATGTFKAGVNYTVGGDPEAMTLSDLNHDGQPDLVVANATTNSVSVLLGKSDGTFQAQAAYATGEGPNFVAVADLDRDGNPDIVTANNFDDTLTILRGTGTGTFTAGATLAAGSTPNSVAIGDLDGDGKLDIVATNYDGDNISVFLGNGDATFKAPVTYAAGAQAYVAVLSDVNGDGKLDVLVSNAGSATVSILLGAGDGTFRPQTTVPTGNFPALFAVADLNGDGAPDMVAPNYNDGTISVLLNDMGHTVSPAYQIDRTTSGGLAPTITSNGGGATAALSVAENSTAVTTVVATDPNPALALTYTIDGGADAARFSIDAQTGVLGFKAAPDFEAPNDAGANNVYDVVVKVSDGTLSDSQNLAVSVTNVNELSSGDAHISGYSQTASTATLTASNDIVDPDVAHPTVTYQWEASTNGGTTWTAVAGATAATYTPSAAQVGSLLHVVATYSDAFGTYHFSSSETALVGNGSVNTLTGNEGINFIVGLGGNDSLNGGGGSDTIDGGAGNDSLNGGPGADRMIGGAGNDTYVVDNAGDVVTELAGGGTDTVQTTLASYTLAANVENLTSTGSADFTATGNSLANTITGGAGNDLFLAAAGDGNDTLNGAGGNDTYSAAATSANSTINLSAGTATSSQIGTDKLVSIENAIGGSGSDKFIASTAVNILTGGGGADTFAFDDGTSHRGAITTGNSAATRDQITDFQQGVDKVDLSAIDANHTSTVDTSDQAFIFKGQVSITNTATAAQLAYHFEAIGGVDHTIVEGTVNPSAGIDFQLDLLGHVTLTAADFIL